MHGQEEDIAIIQLVLKGNQSAYSTLVHRYQSYVFTLIMRHINNRELAEELSQDVFVKAYKYLADFKGNSKFSTWLYTIVHTACLSYMRKRVDAAMFPGDDKLQEMTSHMHAADQPYARIEQQQQKQLIEHSLRHLANIDAEIITLFYQAEQSVEEVAIITGLTPGNVKVRLLRARQKLRDVLKEEHYKETMR